MKSRVVATILIFGVVCAAILTLVILPCEPKGVEVVTCAGYCNLPVFLAAEESNSEGSELIIHTSYVANPGDHAAALTKPNGPLASITPFTSVLVAYASGSPIKIIAGSGMNGLAIVAQPDYKGPDSIKGRKIGTVRGDTLEQLAYSFVEKKRLQGEVEFAYYSDPMKLLDALRAGTIYAMTHVEPFVTMAVDGAGMRLVTRGEELWGQNHPDCVLVTTESALRNRREELRLLIRSLRRAEQAVRNEPRAAVDMVAELYYQMTPSDLLRAVHSQFPQIDIRGSEDFILERAAALRDMGYISTANAVSTIFDFSVLEEAIED